MLDEDLKDCKNLPNPSIFELPKRLQRDYLVKTELLLKKEIRIQKNEAKVEKLIYQDLSLIHI